MNNQFIKIAILSAFLMIPSYALGATKAQLQKQAKAAQAKLQKQTKKILKQTKMEKTINDFGKILYILSSGNKEALQKSKDMSVDFDYSDMEEINNLDSKVESIDCVGFKIINSKSYALYYILNTSNGAVGCQISAFVDNRQLLIDGFKVSRGGVNILGHLNSYDLFPTTLTLKPGSKKQGKKKKKRK